MKLTIKSLIARRHELYSTIGKQNLKLEILDHVIVGTFREVYEKLQSLSQDLFFHENNVITLTCLKPELLEQVFVWIDELPSILEKCRLDYEDKNLELYLRIQKLYKEVLYQLEVLAVEVESYLEGKLEEPSLDFVKRRISYLKLLSSNANILESDIIKAVNDNNTGLVDLLLWNGVNPNITNTYNQTLITIAIIEGYSEMVKLLLKNGADPNTNIYGGGDTILCLAINRNRMDIVKLLLEHGADPNHTNSNNVTPLFCAVDRNREQIAELLLEHGANPDTPSGFNSYRPLCIAAANNFKIVKLLLRYGADKNVPCGLYSSALAFAIAMNYKELVTLLNN